MRMNRFFLSSILFCSGLLLFVTDFSAEEIQRISRHQRHFQVDCSAEGECRVAYRGRELLRYEAQPAEVKPNLVFLRFAPRQGEVFLIDEYQGDGCPAMYRIVEVGPARAFVTPAFGNCDSPTIEVHANLIRFRFSASPEIKRASASYVYRNRQLRNTGPLKN